MLVRAEALIEVGRENEARPLINSLRNRAQSNVFIPYAKNLSRSEYPATGWTRDFAREAVRWERRLELAMEGHRFFDLVRWGIANDVLNNYFKTEGERRFYLKEGIFNKNTDEYSPIPQQQINFTEGSYQQNPGWN